MARPQPAGSATPQVPAPAIVAAKVADVATAQPGDAANRGRIIRKNRELPGKGATPRRSRLKKPAAPLATPPAAKAAPGLPVSAPFPIGG